MKSFYLSGPNGSVLQLSDGRFADTVGGDTSEKLEAHAALEQLLAIEADAQVAPLFGSFSANEMTAYVGLDNAAITLTEAHELHPEIPRSTLNEWARQGKLSAWLSGCTWLTTRQALDEAIARLRPQKGEGKVAIGDEVVVTRDMAIVEYADGTGSYKARKGWVLGGFAGTDGDRIVVHSNHRESGEPVEVIVDKEDVKVG